MSKFVFVCQSTKIHLYLYNCIAAICDEYPDCELIFVINERISKKQFHFNRLVHFIDERFSNFRQNPFDVVDISSKEIKNLKITNDLSTVANCDWIILENNNLDYREFKKITSIGILHLEINYKKIFKSVLFTDVLKIGISYHLSSENKWFSYSQNLKTEKGLKNNLSKLVLNYRVFLIQFLKNQKNIKQKPLKFNGNAKNKFVLENFLMYSKIIFELINRKFFPTKYFWQIGFRKNNEVIFIDQPKNSFWADPFIITNDNKKYVFFEELKSNNIGCISCIELDENFKVITKKTVLDTDFHLSFPNVYKENDDFFMMPESSANNSLDIYKCTNFPFEWQLHHSIMKNIKLIDAVWIFHDDKYWIFANKIEDFEHDNNEKLYLYYADDLYANNWTSHIQNPIITDISNARNAGKIYHKKGAIYRVAQNCFNTYGENLVINKIEILTTNEYKESRVKEIFPTKEFKGLHTMNSDEDLEVFDFLKNT